MFLILAVVLSADGFSQDVAGSSAQLRQLVNVPTAGVLGRGQYEVGMRLFDRGGVLANIEVGVSDRFQFGISYGGENFIGSGNIDFNPLPGVDARYRLIDESIPGPAVAVGFNNQGFGRFLQKVPGDTSGSEVDRYVQKSLGLFIVASKNYAFMGTIGIHGGMNWAVTEKKDKDNQPAFFVGVDKSLNPELSLVSEYILALNDNRDLIGHGRGYLNVGTKFNFNNQIMIDFMMTDVLNNSKQIGKFAREFRLSLVNQF